MADVEKKIQIRVPDDVLKGRYANFVHVSSTREEFIIDFGVINPTQLTGVITDRVFMNPAHVKRMIAVLTKVMNAHEQKHGTVNTAEAPREIGFETL